MSEHIHNSNANNAPAPQDGQFAPGVELLSKALKTVFVVLAAAIIIMLAWFLTCGGSFIVDSTKEEVIVLRFGKFVDGNVYKSGWHWFLPYPVNKIVRIPIIKQEVVSNAFMASNTAKLYNPNAKQTQVAADSLTPGKDGYTILGDNSIMHSDWKMTYRITDTKQYFLNCMSRETVISKDMEYGPSEQVSLGTASVMLKNLLDDAVITVSSSLDVDKTYFDKANYEVLVRKQFEKNIEKAQLGITLESLNLLLVAPPIKSFEAFQNLLLSGAESSAVIEQARTYAVEQENQANTLSAKIIADAKAYQNRIVSQVKADAVYFNEIVRQFKTKPEATFVSLYYGTVANATAEVKDKFILDNNSKTFGPPTLWLKLNQEPEVKKKVEGNNNGGQK